MEPISVRLLSQEEVVATGLTMKTVMETVEYVFNEHGLGHSENPPKPGVHPREDGFIHAMPGYLPRKRIAGLKWVSGFSGNVHHGLPSIMGMIVLNDVDTGKPLAVMDGTTITAMRTAAASGVAARYLAAPGAKTVGIVGASVQGRHHAAAMAEALPGMTTLKVFDVHPETLSGFVSRCREWAGFDVVPTTSVRDVVEGSDVIVTATGKLDQILYFEKWVRLGGLVLPVHMFGWEPGVIGAMDRFIVDDWRQFSPYMEAAGSKYDPMPRPHAELGEVVAGKKPERLNADDRIIDFNLGIALHDVAVADWVYQKALETGVGSSWTMMGGGL